MAKINPTTDTSSSTSVKRKRSEEQDPQIHLPYGQNNLVALNDMLTEATAKLKAATLNAESLQSSLKEHGFAEDDPELKANQLLKMNQYKRDLAAFKSHAGALEQQINQVTNQLPDLQTTKKQETDPLSNENVPPEFRNLYTHLTKFYALVNQTIADLKTTNNQQKRDDKDEVKINQKDKEYYAWYQCTLEMMSGLIAGCMAATSDFGRVAAEFGVSKVAAGANAVLHDKSQRKEHTVQTLDKKQDGSINRNQGLEKINQDIRQSAAQVMRDHHRSLIEPNPNN